MTNLIIFAVVAYGACNIMIYGSIFEKWRSFWNVDAEEPGFFGKLFGCFMCLGFWWGVILSVTMFSPTLQTGLMNDIHVFEFFTIKKEVISVFFDGCLSSGLVWLVHTVQERVEV